MKISWWRQYSTTDWWLIGYLEHGDENNVEAVDHQESEYEGVSVLIQFTLSLSSLLLKIFSWKLLLKRCQVFADQVLPKIYFFSCEIVHLAIIFIIVMFVFEYLILNPFRILKIISVVWLNNFFLFFFFKDLFIIFFSFCFIFFLDKRVMWRPLDVAGNQSEVSIGV